MFDKSFQKLLSRPVDQIAGHAARAGIRANMVTACGALAALATVAAIALAQFPLALILIAVCRALDGLDGAVARVHGRTELGGYLDIVSDYVFYAGVPMGFAMASPTSNALPAAALLASFILTCSSFLAFAAIAKHVNVVSHPSREKAFVYSFGLIEGSETIGFFCAMVVWPEHFPKLASALAFLCTLTAIQRTCTATRTFS